MSDFEFVENENAICVLEKRLQNFPKTRKILNLALTLGACIAGGSAISLMEKIYEESKKNSSISWRDIDLWFSDTNSLNVFLASVVLIDGVVCSPSFGGCAIDLTIKDEGKLLQAVTFKTGSPEKIISDFDFKNCAVALDKRGFYFHAEAPKLNRDRKLSLLNDNSPFFMSRLNKYLRKGYTSLDEKIQKKTYSDLVKFIDSSLEKRRTISLDFDNQKSVLDLKKANSELRKIVSTVNLYLTWNDTLEKFHSFRIFSVEEKDVLHRKRTELEDLLAIVLEDKKMMTKMNYGYYSSGKGDA